MTKANEQEARVWQLLKENKIKQAIATCHQLNRQHPDLASGWHAASHLALKTNRPNVALRAIERAISLDPDHTDWLLQKALCFRQLGQTEQLDSLLQTLLTRKSLNAYHCSSLALLLTHLEKREQAIQFYQRAAKLKPGESQHHYNIAVLQRSLGETDAAGRNFDKAIRLSPKNYEAYKVRSELRTQTPEKNHVKALEKLLKKGIGDQKGKAQICYALAKELEDLGDWKQAFDYLKLGADTRRSYMQYNPQRDLVMIATIRNTYTSGLFDGRTQGDDNDEAIFILGMPRTGTTLVERILSSHSEVFSAGELGNFAVQMMGQVKAQGNYQSSSRDELVALTAGLDFRQLGEDYINSTRPFTGHTPKFIDKLPLNYLYTGLIHLALPNAKIINLKRHPIDTCYAMYKQLFVDGYPFSYELEELGHYFAAYHCLMEHWHGVMPEIIYTVVYEDLVADIEGESRRLIDFCGLGWQEQCLKYYESEDASITASAVQVRKPVYMSSVDKWRQYETQLAPLIAVLEQAGIPLD